MILHPMKSGDARHVFPARVKTQTTSGFGNICRRRVPGGIDTVWNDFDLATIEPVEIGEAPRAEFAYSIDPIDQPAEDQPVEQSTTSGHDVRIVPAVLGENHLRPRPAEARRQRAVEERSVLVRV